MLLSDIEHLPAGTRFRMKQNLEYADLKEGDVVVSATSSIRINSWLHSQGFSSHAGDGSVWICRPEDFEHAQQFGRYSIYFDGYSKTKIVHSQYDHELELITSNKEFKFVLENI